MNYSECYSTVVIAPPLSSTFSVFQVSLWGISDGSETDSPLSLPVSVFPASQCPVLSKIYFAGDLPGLSTSFPPESFPEAALAPPSGCLFMSIGVWSRPECEYLTSWRLVSAFLGRTFWAPFSCSSPARARLEGAPAWVICALGCSWRF